MIFITKLVLHRCKRFYLRGIETLEINPSTKTQIILGTNGSGKSSLLRIGFTVMPPVAKDFVKDAGGYKILHCVGNGHEYELRTMFTGKSPEHWFIVDGENLNEGFTGSTQKELIKQHFGMTQDIHDVLTGQLKFTSMGPQQRRDWITRLSSSDFDYVIKLHQRVKKGLSAAGIIINHQSGRLVDEVAKKLGDEEIAHLNQQSLQMREQLAELYTQLNVELSRSGYEPLRDGISYLNGRIEATVDQMLAINLRPPEGCDDTSMGALGEWVDSLRGNHRALYATLQEVSEQHQLIDKQMHEISILDDIDPVQLQQDIEDRQLAVDTLRSELTTGLDIELLGKNAQQVAAVNDVMTALHSVVPGTGDTYTRDEVYRRQQELQAYQDTYAQGTSRISEIEYRLNHIANCHDVGCPNCGHVFKEGVNSNEESELQETLRKGQSFKANMEAKMDSVRSYLADAKDAHDHLHELARLREQYPFLAGLWNLFGEHGGVVKGRELIPVCTKFIRDSEKAIRIAQLTYELLPLIEKLNQIKQMDKSGSLRELHTNLTNRIADIQGNINANQRQLGIAERYFRDRKDFENLQDELSTMQAQQESQFTRLVDFTYNEEISALVKKYQVSLAMLETSLTEAEMQAGIVKDITKTLEEAKNEEISLRVLEKLLSPKDGLIAEQILVFINTFIASINNVIASVWGYNLVLDNIDLEEGELDYKFPMYIHNRENMIPDIEFGSDSIIDIINQAFRIVVYKFLQLDGYPLYLDEPARAFDAVHSHNLILSMKELIDDERFSQVFYISHNYEGQNSFPNSQIAVIDDSHVTLKRVYNEHVIIT